MKHWTEELFITHADIYAKDLEWMIQGAEKGAPYIKELLSEHGVPEGSLLDVPCGIGRYSFELAKIGYKVHGLDISPLFIDRARELSSERGVSDRCSFEVMDMRKLSEGVEDDSFDAVLNIFTSLGYWDEETDLSILKQFFNATRKNGLLFLDVINRDFIIKNYRSSDTYERLDGLRMTEKRTLDLEKSRMNSTFTYYQKQGEDLIHQAEVSLDHRLYSIHEMKAMIEKAGWAYLEVYGGFDKRPFTTDSNRMVILARKN